jgi:IclR family transcriptional regulator, pca regulon regulatory protein
MIAPLDLKRKCSYNEQVAEFRTVKTSDPELVKPARAAEGMAGLAKGLAVIEAFETAAAPLTVSEAARLAGISRAAARRCLLTLAELGYLTHDGKFFRPTLRMIRLGGAYVSITRLPVLAHPYLAQARDALNESVSLAVWDDGWSVFVDRAESGWMLAGGVRIGARLPAYCTATGRVLLAALSDGEVAAVLDRLPPQPVTPRTVTDPAAIIAAVGTVRRDGYAIVDEEMELGMRTLAVPVRDSRGGTVATLCVNGASARLGLDRLRADFMPVLLDTAAKLGRTQ